MNQGGLIINGTKADLDDIIIYYEDKEGYAVEIDGDLAIVLDLELNQGLIDEGNIREIIHIINASRKKNNVGVMDIVDVTIECPNDIAELIDSQEDRITKECKVNIVNLFPGDKIKVTI